MSDIPRGIVRGNRVISPLPDDDGELVSIPFYPTHAAFLAAWDREKAERAKDITPKE